VAGLLKHLSEKKAVGKSETCIFYKTPMSEESTNYARRENTNGVKLEYYTVLLAELKDGSGRNYVLLNEKNDLLDDASSLEGIEIKIDIHKYLKGQEEA